MANIRSDHVRTTDVSVLETRRHPAMREARARFGGIDVPATIVGMLAALAVLLLLGGLITAAVGAVGYQTGLDEGASVREVTIGGLVGGLVVLFVSFLVGGWAAARIARYDGAKNGLMTGVLALALVAILSALGAWLGAEYNVLREANLPSWFSRDAATTGAIVSGVVAIVAMLAGGLLGGIWGERYHRRADAVIAGTRAGGIVGRTREDSR
jgi:hypothetical protein